MKNPKFYLKTKTCPVVREYNISKTIVLSVF